MKSANMGAVLALTMTCSGAPFSSVGRGFALAAAVLAWGPLLLVTLSLVLSPIICTKLDHAFLFLVRYFGSCLISFYVSSL